MLTEHWLRAGPGTQARGCRRRGRRGSPLRPPVCPPAATPQGEPTRLGPSWAHGQRHGLRGGLCSEVPRADLGRSVSFPGRPHAPSPGHCFLRQTLLFATVQTLVETPLGLLIPGGGASHGERGLTFKAGNTQAFGRWTGGSGLKAETADPHPVLLVPTCLDHLQFQTLQLGHGKMPRLWAWRGLRPDAGPTLTAVWPGARGVTGNSGSCPTRPTCPARGQALKGNVHLVFTIPLGGGTIGIPV